ncbi:hypothetical protein CC86DRAFT_451130 [Ophiobolus disseminans]|uniref:Uncharacterized protein n=1 Tax=Ophiobolus disseminans TaxID=1469910 RepID=A0A6A7AJN0_9PLEO|nr:hypothetical protein CC86DRAFT_451130 [Ophiobolus disseminans]
MSHQYSDSYRPSGNNRTLYQNSYTPNYNTQHSRPAYHNNYNSRPHNNNSSNNRRPWKDWDTINHTADDQIAPEHSSQSVTDLQRWARATAELPQQGYHFKETSIIERIERRYASEDVNPNAPFPRYSNGVDEAEREPLSGDGVQSKRRRSLSPNSLARAMSGDASAVSVMRDAKRRRTDLAEQVIDLTGEMDEDEVDYAESSEWSFPDSEMEVTGVENGDRMWDVGSE